MITHPKNIKTANRKQLIALWSNCSFQKGKTDSITSAST